MACISRFDQGTGAVFRSTASAQAVRGLLQAILAHPLLACVAENARGCTEIVLAEVLNNIVEHAYAAMNGEIELRINLQAGQMFCDILDDGAPMPGLALPAGLAQPIGPDQDLQEGGYGWFLIRSLTENLLYRRIDARNHLCFQINIEQ